MANIIRSREGVTQGDPLDMVSYIILTLLLIKRLNPTYSDVTQTWNDNGVGSLGTFNNLEQYSNSLKRNNTYRGYYLGPTKIIMIVHPINLESGGLFGQCHGFKVCTGARYLGGYIQDDKSKVDWLKKHTEK